MRLSNTIEWLLIAIMISLMLDIIAARHHRHLAHQRHHQHQHQHQHRQLIAHSSKHQQHSSTRITKRTGRAATTGTAMSSSWFGPEFMIARRVYEDCQEKNDFIGCLKQKALHALSRALEQDSIKIVDGLVLEKQNSTEKESIMNSLTDARTLTTLSPVDRALLAKIDKLTRTHALKIDMSQGRGHGDDDDDDHGHKKKKDKGGGHIKYVIAALLTAMGIAGPIGLKALAAIATKALVISKVALTIAGIIALKKLFSHDHQEESSFQVHAGDHNRRSTYVIRPVSKTNQPTAAGGISQYSDPYRYYYEYH
ncbi:PREDICTED: uncharacterized protein LOC108359583 [Rhagoletis zephyria]|uniref:uncharacterized protein LOC108359583 n=1 Tax=Rhagoletis zephyria TaxID=28612 RepID=UPI000811A2EB|nr:PREDICTED: uncharacterized protein LOC108359583 [Rhagoletis zephyria]